MRRLPAFEASPSCEQQRQSLFESQRQEKQEGMKQDERGAQGGVKLHALKI